MISSDSWLSRSRGVPFLNGSGMVIPPFACMVIDSASTENQELVLTCRQMTQADLYLTGVGSFVFNGETEIPSSSGAGGLAYLDPVITAVGASIAIGDECGPAVGSWELSALGAGYWKLGDVSDSASNGIIVRQAPNENSLVIRTPGTGIPAKGSTSPPYSFGSAMCEVVDPVTETHYSPSRFVSVKNVVNQQIAPNAVGKAEKCQGVYIIDVASCS